MTGEQANAVAKQFGYYAREEASGFFLAPVRRDSWGATSLGDDEMLVKPDGEIVPYATSAQGFLAAKALAEAGRVLRSSERSEAG